MTFFCDNTSNLICSICKKYLSCGPIYTQKKNTICGRCTVNDDNLIRNYTYEIIALKLRFPCIYWPYGCRETQPFVTSYKNSHEYSCEYKTFECEFSDDNKCNWKNVKSELVKHCKIKHPNNILHNCDILNIDYKNFTEKTYLFIAFELEFVLWIKRYSYEEDNKICFTLDYMGNERAGSKFQYFVNVQRNQSLITKTGFCGTSIVEIEMYILSDIFDSVDNLIFRVQVTITCHGCKETFILGKLYNKRGNWYCIHCSPIFVACKNKLHGCNFKETSQKVFKHEVFFCKYYKTQYDNKFSSILFGINNLNYYKPWILKNKNDKVTVMTDIGVVIAECMYTNNREKIKIFIYSAIETNKKSKFTCKVYISNKVTKQCLVKSPAFEVDKTYDWSIEIDKMEYPFYELVVLILVQRITLTR